VESCLKKYGVEYITQTDSYKEKKKYIKKNMDQKHIIIPKTKTRINNGTQINDDDITKLNYYKKNYN
jgi:hypothetical protein